MKEQLITFETAKLAKEKGFDIPIQHTVNKQNLVYSEYSKDLVKMIDTNVVDNWNDPKFIEICSAPTQSLLQKWLREVHKINLVPDCMWIKGGYECTGYDLNNENKEIISLTKYGKYPTYEEALEAGLQEALKLIS